MPRVDIAAQPDHVGTWTEVVIDEKRGSYLYRILDRLTADVYKSQDSTTPAYEIRDGICSCPAAIHSKLCKHVKVVQKHNAAGNPH